MSIQNMDSFAIFFDLPTDILEHQIYEFSGHKMRLNKLMRQLDKQFLKKMNRKFKGVIINKCVLRWETVYDYEGNNFTYLWYPEGRRSDFALLRITKQTGNDDPIAYAPSNSWTIWDIEFLGKDPIQFSDDAPYAQVFSTADVDLWEFVEDIQQWWQWSY